MFQKIEEKDLLAYVRSKPTGKYARRLWFLYEFLTGKALPLDDLGGANYIDLLEKDKYYTVTPARQVRRQRINDNLLGDSRFCPVVRRTSTLLNFEKIDLHERCRQVVTSYSPELLRRALQYCYTRETKSSLGLERIIPTSIRTERFMALLRTVEQEDFCRKPRLIDAQNRIVDTRFRDSDYRSCQNYLGETIIPGQEQIHFVSPGPEHLADLMDGLTAAHERMHTGGVSAVVRRPPSPMGLFFCTRSRMATAASTAF